MWHCFNNQICRKKRAARNIHILLAGRNEQRQHYLAGKRMTRQCALWVGEEMSNDSDICSLFMSVSTERAEEKGVDRGRGEGKG